MKNTTNNYHKNQKADDIVITTYIKDGKKILTICGWDNKEGFINPIMFEVKNTLVHDKDGKYITDERIKKYNDFFFGTKLKDEKKQHKLDKSSQRYILTKNITARNINDFYNCLKLL